MCILMRSYDLSASNSIDFGYAYFSVSKGDSLGEEVKKNIIKRYSKITQKLFIESYSKVTPGVLLKSISNVTQTLVNK